MEIDIAGEQFNASGRVVLAVSTLFCYILVLFACLQLVTKYHQYFKQSYVFSFSGAACSRLSLKVTFAIT